MGKIFAALLVMALFAGCGVSRYNADRLKTATEDVASHLRAGGIDAIYNASEPFRHTTTLDNWRSWTNSVRDHWGVLQEVKIVHIERLVPSQGVYIVDTEMHYERGTTMGKFTFGIRSKEPVLVGAILIDSTQQLPRTSSARSPQRQTM
jgi:hypothetical protein